VEIMHWRRAAESPTLPMGVSSKLLLELKIDLQCWREFAGIVYVLCHSTTCRSTPAASSSRALTDCIFVFPGGRNAFFRILCISSVRICTSNWWPLP